MISFASHTWLRYPTSLDQQQLRAVRRHRKLTDSSNLSSAKRKRKRDHILDFLFLSFHCIGLIFFSFKVIEFTQGKLDRSVPFNLKWLMLVFEVINVSNKQNLVAIIEYLIFGTIFKFVSLSTKMVVYIVLVANRSSNYIHGNMGNCTNTWLWLLFTLLVIRVMEFYHICLEGGFYVLIPIKFCIRFNYFY